MAEKITYQDKVRVRTAGAAVNSWLDDDANEVKTVVNANADLITGNRITGPVLFTRLNQWHSSPSSPHATTITINPAGAIDGAVVGMYYKGVVLNRGSIAGANVQIFSGENTADELCIVWMVWDGNANVVNVNIQVNGVGEVPPPPGDASATAPTITVTSPGTIIVAQDDFAGTVIDTSKWAVTNPSTGSVTQNEALIFTSSGAPTSGDNQWMTYINQLTSDVRVVQFDIVSASAFEGYFPQSSLGDTTENRILFDRIQGAPYDTARWRMQLSASVVDSQDTGTQLVNTWKIVMNNTAVRCYYWGGASWVLDYEYITGNFNGFSTTFRFGINGFSGTTVSDTVVYDNVYICNEDYATQFPT